MSETTSMVLCLSIVIASILVEWIRRNDEC